MSDVCLAFLEQGVPVFLFVYISRSAFFSAMVVYIYLSEVSSVKSKYQLDAVSFLYIYFYI
jgi:hypothetical protein